MIEMTAVPGRATLPRLERTPVSLLLHRPGRRKHMAIRWTTQRDVCRDLAEAGSKGSRGGAWHHGRGFEDCN